MPLADVQGVVAKIEFVRLSRTRPGARRPKRRTRFFVKKLATPRPDRIHWISRIERGCPPWNLRLPKLILGSSRKEFRIDAGHKRAAESGQTASKELLRELHTRTATSNSRECGMTNAAAVRLQRSALLRRSVLTRGRLAPPI